MSSHRKTEARSNRRLEINISKKIVNSIAAGLTIGITILILQFVHFDLAYGSGSSAIIYSSVGASAFILMVMPKSRAASNSAVIVSYIIAGIVGYLSYQALPYFGVAVASAIAVSLTGALMVFFRKEHPPAAGLALAFVLFRINLYGILLVIGIGFLIVAISHILGIFIKDVEKEI